MVNSTETFFTSVGCMDGRVQGPVLRFGQDKFGARFADTITEAGLVGQLSRDQVDQQLRNSLMEKLEISIKKHNSRGIIVHGHQDCAGNPVSDDVQRDDIRRSVTFIKTLVGSSVTIIGVFVWQKGLEWIAEEVPQTLTA